MFEESKRISIEVEIRKKALKDAHEEERLEVEIKRRETKTKS
jgi:hypothetical protein